MAITLIRIDDRLIHGQVIQGWVRHLKIERILVCNDEVASDEMRKALIEIAVPVNLKILILTVDEAAKVAKEVQFTKERTLLLFSKPGDLVRFGDLGVMIKSVNIGAMHFSPGKEHILETISVEEEDVLALKELARRGVELEVRTVPTDTKRDIMKFLK